MSNLVTQAQNKAKSFWDTKEGTTGMIFGLGILGGLGWAAYKLMPYIANLMENTFYAIGFGLLSIGLIYAFVIDGTLRNRMWMAYKLLMRALTYSIIKYDPIGILREIQKKAKERLKLVDDNRATVRGQVTTIKNTIDSFDRDEQQLKRMIETQQRKGAEQQEIAGNAMKLGRVHDAKLRLQKSYDQTNGFYNQLTRAYNALVTVDENIDFEIGIMEREYKAVTASHTAWKAVKAAFKGGELDDLRNDTLQFLAEDYSMKLGQIETFMDDSQKFINGVDLQNSMYTDEGMKLLEDLNSRDLNIVQKVQTTQSITATQTVSIPSFNPGARMVDYTVKKGQ